MRPSEPYNPAPEQQTLPDLQVSEDGVRICWKQFATTLPKEDAALAGRLMHIRPSLKEETTIDVSVENEMVAADIRSIQPRIEAYLRQQLQNGKLSITITINKGEATVHIYGRLEQYMMMEKRNPALSQLKTLLDLDLE